MSSNFVTSNFETSISKFDHVKRQDEQAQDTWPKSVGLSVGSVSVSMLRWCKVDRIDVRRKGRRGDLRRSSNRYQKNMRGALQQTCEAHSST
jgi:DNA-directed RNA polymerase